MPDIQLVLRFSDEYAARNSVIEDHCFIVDKYGSCWWGWFKAAHEPDHGSLMRSKLDPSEQRPIRIGLNNRSQGQYFIAVCDAMHTSPGGVDPVAAPDPKLTPDYMFQNLILRYPAWFRLTAISQCTADELFRRTDRLGKGFLWPNDTTVFWPDIETREIVPVKSSVAGDTVLHISDLHFGPAHRWHTKRSPKPHMPPMIDGLLEQMQRQKIGSENRVGVVVISGDISSQGPKEDAYADALDFLWLLRRNLQLRTDQFVIVPGNHDFERSHAPEANEPDFSKRIEDSRSKKGEELYRNFLMAAYETQETQPLTRWSQFDFEDLGDQQSIVRANFLSLNSANARGPDSREYGFVGRGHHKIATLMRDDWEQQWSTPNQVINFAVMHHHVISAMPEERVPVRQEPSGKVDPVSSTVDAIRLLDDCRECRIRFVLHGHQHVPQWSRIIRPSRDVEIPEWRVDVIGTGSLGAVRGWLDPDHPKNYFSLYTLRNSAAMDVRVVQFTEDHKAEPLYLNRTVPTPGEVEWK